MLHSVFQMLTAHTALTSQKAYSAAPSMCEAERQAFAQDAAADEPCKPWDCAPDAAKADAGTQSAGVKPVVRVRGPSYSWTIWDHCALLTSSTLLMVRRRGNVNASPLQLSTFVLQKY